MPQTLSFEAKLERISDTLEYYALSVPAKITAAVGTHGPVPVKARVNGGTPFSVSLYPRGGGHHGMRIKAGVREEAKVKGGDRVRVEITVIDRHADVALPKEVADALRKAGALEAYQALPKGEQRYALRRIEEAAKPETRAKRIREAARQALEKRR